MKSHPLPVCTHLHNYMWILLQYWYTLENSCPCSTNTRWYLHMSTTTTITKMLLLIYTSHTNLYNLHRLLPVQIHLYSNIGRTQQSCYKVENSCVGEWHIRWYLHGHEHTVIIWQLRNYIHCSTILYMFACTVSVWVYTKIANAHNIDRISTTHTFTWSPILSQCVPISTTTCESSFSIGTHLRTIVHVQQTLIDIYTCQKQIQSLIWSLYPTHHTPTSTTSTVFFQFKSISTVTLVGPSRVVTKLRTVVLESDTLVDVYKDMNILSSFNK